MKLPYLGVYNSFLGQSNGRFPITTVANDMSHFHFSRPTPHTLKGPQWRLRPLQKENAAITYEAYLRNPQAIICPNSESKPYTWQDHTGQIAQAEQNFWAGGQFLLALLNPQETKCLGGVQIAPLRPFFRRHNAPGRLMIRADQNTAMITYWLCTSCQEQEFAAQFVAALHRWLLTQWELTDHLFRTNPADAQTISTLQTAGLQARVCLSTSTPPYQYAFYGR